MKNVKACPEAKSKDMNFKLWLLAFSFVLLAFIVLGCNESLQRTIGFPNNVRIDDLKAEAIQIVRDGLADDDPRIRPKAIEVVADTRQIVLMPKVQRLLKDEYEEVRFLAALAVGDLQYSLAKNEIMELLKDEDGNVRIAAAYAAARLGSAESFDILRKAIASNDQTIRANAALLLGKSGDQSVLKFLYWALRRNDSDDKVRFQAAEAIAMLGDERLYPKLWTMLISVYADDRVTGIRAMGALGTAQAKDSLIIMLDDDVLEVRLAAAEHLGKLGDRSGELEVLKVFRKNLARGLDKKDAERVKVRTALAIGEIGTASLTKFLPQMLRSESKLVRIAAAKAVLSVYNGKQIR